MISAWVRINLETTEHFEMHVHKAVNINHFKNKYLDEYYSSNNLSWSILERLHFACNPIGVLIAVKTIASYEKMHSDLIDYVP